MLPDRTPQRTAPPRKHNTAQIFTLSQQRMRCVLIGDQALVSKLPSAGNRSARVVGRLQPERRRGRCHIFGPVSDIGT
jgi:hypothetical protein